MRKSSLPCERERDAITKAAVIGRGGGKNLADALGQGREIERGGSIVLYACIKSHIVERKCFAGTHFGRRISMQ